MLSYYGSMIVLVPAILFAMLAQWSVKSTFAKYSKIRNKKNYTGRDAAELILKSSGIGYVRINAVRGSLSDHYNPKNQTVNLSEPVYDKTTLSALAVAAHECGHAMQDRDDYHFMRFRHLMLPAVNFANRSAMPLAILGLVLGAGTQINSIGGFILKIAILMFAVVLAFHVVTLPVEINASRRALRILEDNGYLDSDEIGGAKAVLRAAALTYIAAAAVALSNLLRFVLIARRRD